MRCCIGDCRNQVRVKSRSLCRAHYLRWKRNGDFEPRRIYFSGPLTQARLKQLFFYDKATGIFTRLLSQGGQLIGEISNRPCKDGYVRISIDNQLYLAHRLAFLYVEGRWPPHHIDHKNLDRSFNAWDNLRPASWSQNNHHMMVKNSTGFRGVVYLPAAQKFRAKIRCNGRHIHLGVFDSPEDAHAAYCAAAQQHFGEFATTEVKVA